ncbi:MAG: DUF177 domain-containing protein [Alistipes sp.]|jgi:uncharacterized metal-binding protein YceD (DUF177 family)|nr:DUF177 domain-containing protein [Alistipes sp.]
MRQRYTIAHRGLREGTHDYKWVVESDFWTARPESGITGGEVEVSVTLEKSATGTMRIEVSAHGSVTVPCDRCLEDCALPVDYRGGFAVKTSEEELPFEGDVLWIGPGEATIDLEQYIYESIVLSLPLQRVHPEDVHGRPLCNPAMLERFKIVTEEEFDTMIND